MGHLDYSAASHEHTSKTEDHSHEEDQKREELLQFSEEEETIVDIMFALVGERWSLIAGRIPGRTAEDIQMYWNTRRESCNKK